MTEKPTGAPALEKGLDIIEALAEEPDGLPQKVVAERVGRSVGEIFRMLNALEQRGYVARDANGHYALTLRLFELAHRHPPQRRLLQAALEAMEDLSAEIVHTSHLVVMHGGRLMVLAQVQPDSVLMGWSVRVGAVFPIAEKYASARVISAFQRSERQQELVQMMVAESGGRLSSASIRKRLAAITTAGYDSAPSQIALGIVDVSCPVFNHFGHAAAALTVPCMSPPGKPVAEDRLIDAVRQAAKRISLAIGAGEGSPKAR